MIQTGAMTEVDPVSTLALYARLERTYIEAYLARYGYIDQELKALPEAEARTLRIRACVYASCRMAEIEARASLMQKLRVHEFSMPFRKTSTISSTQSSTEMT